MKLQQLEREIIATEDIESEKWGVQIESTVHVYIDKHICLCWLYLLRVVPNYYTLERICNEKTIIETLK